MNYKLDWNAFKCQFHPSWHSHMKKIIESPEVWEIYQQLKQTTALGKKITPPSKDTFAAFRSDLNYIRVVMMGMSPYPKIDFAGPKACGLAFDCRNYGRVSPSLEKLYEAWEDDCYQGFNLKYDQQNLKLDYLMNQGVMLANAALTCEKDLPKSHLDLWQPFWIKVFDQVFAAQTGLIFIFLGQDAQSLIGCCDPNIHHILECEHPAAASYAKRGMDHKNVFSKANELLKGMNNYKISWLLDEDVPF